MLIRVATCNPNYLFDEHTQDRAGKYRAFSRGAEAVGFTYPFNQRLLAAFRDGVRPDDNSPMVRMQRNHRPYVFGVIYYVDSTVNALYKHANAWGKDYMCRAVMSAMLEASRCRDGRLYVGVGAGGKDLQPCRSISYFNVHDVNGKLETSLHGHEWGQQAGQFSGRHNGWWGSRTLSVRNKQDWFLSRREASFTFQVMLGVELERQGVRCDYRDGKCVVVGIPHASTLGIGTRHQDMNDWLAKKNMKPTPATKALAAAATKPKPQKYVREEVHARWDEEIRTRQTPPPKTEPPRGFFQRMWEQNFAAPARVMLQALKAPFRREGRKFDVDDVDGFLAAVRKKTRWEAHRAAYGHLLHNQYETIPQALRAAGRIYARVRRQRRRKLTKRDVVTIADKIDLTDKQIDRLAKLADKVKCTVLHKGVTIQEHQQQRQQRAQEHER